MGRTCFRLLLCYPFTDWAHDVHSLTVYKKTECKGYKVASTIHVAPDP